MSDEQKQQNAAPPAADAKQHTGPAKPNQQQEPEQAESQHNSAAEPDRGTRESARRVTAAANNPGSTATKRRQRAQSRQNLNVGTSSGQFDRTRAGRDIAGRDIYHISAGQQEIDETYEIGLDVRMANNASYVTPPSFDALVSFSEKRAIAVIRVARGQGKFATALRVADEICSGPLYGLSPKKPLDRLDSSDIGENAGYVLTGLTQAQADATLTRHGLARMTAHLAKKSAKLVIAVGAEMRLGQLRSTDCVTDLTDVPACHDVLRTHLEHHIGTRATDALLASPDLVELRAAELTDGAGPRAAADLANLIAHVYRSDSPHAEIVAEVRELLTAHKKREFDDWFAQLGDLAKHSFVIALAVLNGLQYEMVAHAGRVLEDQLTKPAHGNVQNLPRDQVQPFRTSLTARLKEFDAKLTIGDVDPPGDVVVFNDPDRPREVLLHVWQQFGDAHEGVINWLYELGGHKVTEVRVRAGVAVGMLASVAYDLVLHSVVERWANSKNEYFRETAAIAVDAVNAVPGLKERVHTLVRDWCEKGTPYQIATGVRVYGGSVGLDHPSELFAALDQQAESTHSVVLDAVFESLTELAEAGVVGVTDRALMTARRWATSRNRNLRITGNLAFLLMAADLLWPPSAASGTSEDNGKTRWPLLLRVAENSAEWRSVIAQMWTAALFDAETADAAIAVLDRWAHSAETDATRRGAFIRLLHEAAANVRVNARLRQASQGWADPNNAVHAPLTAAAYVTSRERTP